MASVLDCNNEDVDKAWVHVRDTKTGEVEWARANTDAEQHIRPILTFESLLRADVRIMFEILISARTILKNCRAQVEANPGHHIAPELKGALFNDETILLFQLVISEAILRVKTSVMVPSKSELFAHVVSLYPYADSFTFECAYILVKETFATYCPRISNKLES